MPVTRDLIVIGGGAAGLGAARAGAAAGARVILAAEGQIGGECTFTGCVPSKTLIEAAARGTAFPAAMAAVRQAVATIAATETAEVLAADGIEVLRGRAVFTAPREISVNGRVLRAPALVIATGSQPAAAPVPGLEEVSFLTNETIFGLGELPARLAVLGGGPVGCELAQALGRLGSQVTVIEAAPRLLPAADPEASQVLEQVLAGEGITVRAGAAAARVKRGEKGVVLMLASGEEVTADRLVVTGRRPVTGRLGLETAGISADERGFIRTDRRLATSAAGIYAAGDVTGKMPFTHAAFAMGRLAARNALRRRWSPPRSFATGAIPWVVFTDPEIAQVGLTEAQAAASRPGARVAYLPMSEADRAVTAGRTAGFIKIIAGRRRILGAVGGGRVLGATIVASRAGEMIHEPALAMRAGLFTGRLAQATHAYPTWSLAIQQATAQFFGRSGGRAARPASGRQGE